MADFEEKDKDQNKDMLTADQAGEKDLTEKNGSTDGQENLQQKIQKRRILQREKNRRKASMRMSALSADGRRAKPERCSSFPTIFLYAMTVCIRLWMP